MVGISFLTHIYIWTPSTYKQTPVNASMVERSLAHLATVLNEIVALRAKRDGKGNRKEVDLNLNISVKKEQQ